jgi:hypothetical protein
MQYAIPVVAVATLVVSVMAAFVLVGAAALFAGALAVARAENVGESVGPLSSRR